MYSPSYLVPQEVTPEEWHQLTACLPATSGTQPIELHQIPFESSLTFFFSAAVNSHPQAFLTYLQCPGLTLMTGDRTRWVNAFPCHCLVGTSESHSVITRSSKKERAPAASGGDPNQKYTLALPFCLISFLPLRASHSWVTPTKRPACL